MALNILACFYCKADSTQLLVFFIALIGSLVLATVCFGIGFFLKGKFSDSEETKFEVFRAEERF